jgi:Uma2 family endonuclease
MVSVTTLPFSRPLTRADLEKMPDDGHRYELIDGALIVTPAPATQHQSVVLELAVLLREHCADNLKVLIAPFDVALSEDTVIQPDVLVARRGDLTERDLPARPELAVDGYPQRGFC